MKPGYDGLPEMFDKMFRGGVTGEGAAHTWTYTPSTTMSITVGPRQGLKVGLRLVWDSLVAGLRRDTVTVEMWDES